MLIFPKSHEALRSSTTVLRLPKSERGILFWTSSGTTSRVFRRAFSANLLAKSSFLSEGAAITFIAPSEGDSGIGGGGGGRPSMVDRAFAPKPCWAEIC